MLVRHANLEVANAGRIQVGVAQLVAELVHAQDVLKTEPRWAAYMVGRGNLGVATATHWGVEAANLSVSALLEVVQECSA